MIPRGRGALIACAFLTVGCRSAAVSDSRSPTDVLRSEFDAEELAFVRADSESFEAVVSDSLERTRTYAFRVDSRPYGVDSMFTIHTIGYDKEDRTFPRLTRRDVIRRIIENRKAILRVLSVDEGGPRPISRCAGALMEPRVSPDDPTYADSLAQLRGGCPAKGSVYMTVSLPLRGVPESILRLRGRYRSVKDLDLTGEIWTAIVDASGHSPAGGVATESAYMLKRDAATGRLKLVEKLMLMIAE